MINSGKIMDDNGIIIEQYKLYVEMADRISQRRAESNKFFITLLSSMLIVASKEFALEQEYPNVYCAVDIDVTKFT